MNKKFLSVALVATLAGSMLFTSCIGKFALTNKVMSWNRTVSNKFVNELIFLGFWILPVYEVTAMADILVINSIEFWSGVNPVACGTKAIDTENGRYLVKCDGKGYDIVNETTGETVRLNFLADTRTWAVEVDGEQMPILTYIDDTHVKMITPSGDFRQVELSEQGVMAYQQEVSAAMPLMAAK